MKPYGNNYWRSNYESFILKRRNEKGHARNLAKQEIIKELNNISTEEFIREAHYLSNGLITCDRCRKIQAQNCKTCYDPRFSEDYEILIEDLHKTYIWYKYVKDKDMSKITLPEYSRSQTIQALRAILKNDVWLNDNLTKAEIKKIFLDKLDEIRYTKPEDNIYQRIENLERRYGELFECFILATGD